MSSEFPVPPEVEALQNIPAESAEPVDQLPDRLLSDDSVKDYLRNIGRIPLLNAEQEVELSKAIEAGLYAEHLLGLEPEERAKHSDANEEELQWFAEQGLAAREHFLSANTRLVIKLAATNRRSLPLEDAIQEGNLGLIRAVEKFDYTKGWKFSTYATWWIRQSVQRGVAERSRNIRVPVHLYEEMNKLSATIREFEKEGIDPTPEELAAELDTTPERILNVLEWSRDTVSLETPIGDEDATLGDMIGAEMPELISGVTKAELKDQINSALSAIPAREATAIRMRFGLGTDTEASLKEIGNALGVSAERSRQLLREGISKLKRINTGLEEYFQNEEAS